MLETMCYHQGRHQLARAPDSSFLVSRNLFLGVQVSRGAKGTSTLFSHCFRCVLCLSVRELFRSREFRDFREASKRSKRQIRESQGDPSRASGRGFQGGREPLQGESGSGIPVSSSSKQTGTCGAGRAGEPSGAALRLGRVWAGRSQAPSSAFKEVCKGLQGQT